MVFNSIEFLGYIIPVATIYYILNRNRALAWRNIFLLAASWLFYGLMQWWFLGLLFYVIVVNYCGGIAINRFEDKSKQIITATIILSLAILGFMKYAYMFNRSIIMPVGLSFFTFQALAYSIDVYRKKIPVERDFVKVALYISFLPTIMSGPIERARNLLPQLSCVTPMNFSNVTYGIKIFIWGLFKKVVIADRLAVYVNEVYVDQGAHSGSTLALAALFYSVQIYCDFSGYADMAIGVGRALGFTIMENFKFPYFSTTIKSFWRKWHISLTSWFTEYVYFSLGGNRVNELRWIFNIMVIFLLSGIWHGATMAFIIWGAIHGFAYLIEHYMKLDKPNFFYGVVCFIVVTLAWIYFRVEDSTLATTIVKRIFMEFSQPLKTSAGGSSFSFYVTVAILIIFIIREIVSYKSSKEIRLITNAECIFLLLFVALFGVSSSQFVYFQF